MKKNVKILIGCGIFCVLLALLSSWYAVNFNDSRLVAPTDFSGFEFTVKDIPMIVSLVCILVYGFALLITLFACIWKVSRQVAKTNTTRRLSPQFGWLGLCGFLGFLGFWTFSIDGSYDPFVFFGFFGFFGFFYEGKMSGTFMDERFRENAARAQLDGMKVICASAVLAIVVICMEHLFSSPEHTLMAVTIILSLGIALSQFLSEYLLYRYDHDDQQDEE